MRLPKGIASFLLTLLLLAVPVVAFAKRDAIYDYLRLRGYNPPVSIVALAASDTMTPQAKHLFYINHPQLINDASTFRSDCPQSEQTIVLGCYLSIQRGIYVYQVRDERLNGVQEVTAAHEMLHAAYDRLSTKDRSYIDGLLENYYSTQTDQRIKDTIDAYKKTEPNDVVNEMHSVFGTEISNLPPALEAYYKRYFINRAAVIVFSNKYEGEFTKRINQINQYDQQLAAMKQTITDEENQLNAEQAQIESQRNQLNQLRRSGDTQAYNAAVTGFNQLITSYNLAVAKLQNEISDYNSLVQTRNLLASELRSLDNSLDTRLVPQTM